MDNNNNNTTLVTSSAKDKDNDNIECREYTRTADMAARAVTATQRFAKRHYRGILATAGCATALGILYALRRNNDNDDAAESEPETEYEFDTDTDVEVADTPVSNNTL